MTSYVVATVHYWNIKAYDRYSRSIAGNWHIIQTPEAFTSDALENINPRYIFLPHWSWRVPPEIFNRYDCVAFHATDLPFGRGGSPIQNLIARGYSETIVSAFRVTNALDAGDIYLKRSLSLEGSAETIYTRCANVIETMITEIIEHQPTPTPQIGEPVVFERRTPEQSELSPELSDLVALYDHIRMLDAPGYPHAFLRLGRYKLLFREAELRGTTLQAKVTITEGEK